MPSIGTPSRWRTGVRVLDLTSMARKPAPRWMRFGVAAASWIVGASIAQEALEADLGSLGRQLEERIELQLKGGAAARPPRPQPERSHEDAIEPWELVSV
jgi:hypothetical protein